MLQRSWKHRQQILLGLGLGIMQVTGLAELESAVPRTIGPRVRITSATLLAVSWERVEDTEEMTSSLVLASARSTAWLTTLFINFSVKSEPERLQQNILRHAVSPHPLPESQICMVSSLINMQTNEPSA